METTLVIIKPDAVRRNLIGEIVSCFEQGGLHIVAMKMVRLTRSEAEHFYIDHQGKEFFDPLIAFMTSTPIITLLLSGDNAIERVRAIMGATDPARAADGTIRKDFALNKRENSVHGSDSPKSAAREISFFFSTLERCHLQEPSSL